jgi:uncharacterized protein (DUF736 family)
MFDFKKEEGEIGALWNKTSPRGDFMTGIVNGEPVVVFKITNKRSPKAPDWRVLKAKPKAEPVHQADEDIGF